MAEEIPTSNSDRPFLLRSPKRQSARASKIGIRIRACAVWFSASILGVGCASIMKGTNQTVRFESDPPGATVRISGRALGTTPCDVVVQKKAVSVVEFSLEGYQTRMVNASLEGKLSTEPWFWGNVGLCLFFFVPGGVGALVDMSSGAMWSIQSPFATTLYPIEQKPPQTGTGFHPGSSLDPGAGIPSGRREASVAERIAALKELKDQGLISDDEYTERRQALLDAVVPVHAQVTETAPPAKERVHEVNDRNRAGAGDRLLGVE